MSSPMSSPLSSPPSSPLAAGLYIVATPIGNLRDISLRALDVLARADAVLCEDTRHSRKLFAAHNIRARCESYHDHSPPAQRARYLSRLKQGASLALISDAGTPVIADPGYRLVREAQAAGIAVVPIPGASAPLAALSAAGLPSDRFAFFGFAPVRAQALVAWLAEIAAWEHTAIGFARASRVLAIMRACVAQNLAREIVLARELTKAHESFLRGLPAELAEKLAPPNKNLRGECVLLFAPPAAHPKPSEADIDAALRAALATRSPSAAAAQVARALGLERRAVYARALQLRDKKR